MFIRREPKFKIKHKSRCLQNRKLGNWGPSMSIGGCRPTLGAGPVFRHVITHAQFVSTRTSCAGADPQNFGGGMQF